MMKENLKIFIVEDMAVARLALVRVLKASGFEVVGSASKAQTAFDKITSSPLDIVLIDINLLGKEDGIWLGDKIRSELSIPFIYITAYGDDHTLGRLAETKPDGYLMKPYDKPTLITTIKIAYYKFHEMNEVDQTDHKPEQNFLLVYKGIARIKISFDEINYIESDGNYVNCYTEEGVYIKRSSIKSLLKLLPPSNFIRIDKGVIVNLDMVKELVGDYAILTNNVKLHISRSNKKVVRKAFSDRF